MSKYYFVLRTSFCKWFLVRFKKQIAKCRRKAYMNQRAKVRISVLTQPTTLLVTVFKGHRVSITASSSIFRFWIVTIPCSVFSSISTCCIATFPGRPPTPMAVDWCCGRERMQCIRLMKLRKSSKNINIKLSIYNGSWTILDCILSFLFE